jgi:hypothetical protein
MVWHTAWYEYDKRSTFIVLPAVQDGFAHAVDILLSLVFALPHVYICYDLAPSGLDVELGQFLFVNGLFPDVFGCPLDLLLLLTSIVLLKLTAALSLACFLVMPLTFLHHTILTLFSRRVFWMRSSYSRMRRVVSSSSKSLNPSSPSGSATAVGWVEP